MLLTITTTRRPASEIGYLLAKHPDRTQAFELSFGSVHVFYPEVGEDRCTFALLLDVDPIGLVRGRGDQEGFSLHEYVNDRPYVASSFLSVALSQVLGSALNGRCAARPELLDVNWPLEARLHVVPCRGGEPLLRRLFEPLGYRVAASRHPLDPRFPEWGESPYYEVVLQTEARLQDLLSHIYILIPVLDDEKHYWVGSGEVEKLLSKGAAWLPDHPERELISDRYLKHRRHLTRIALARLAEEDDPDPDATSLERAGDEAPLEERLSLNEQRLGTVLSVLKGAGARSVVDLGCGEGKLLKTLLESRSATGFDFDRIVGADVSMRCLEYAKDRLDLDRRPEGVRRRVELLQGSLTYRDTRLSGFDAACLVEVIEHLDPSRLPSLERVIFEFARPRVVIVTTPNREYNTLFPTLVAGKMRHRDHRFEWNRAEFGEWCASVADRNGYRVRALPVGPEDPVHGPPTQMGVFER